MPPAMIPSEFVNVESFPLSTNGKIDRKGLAESIQKNIKVKHNAKATLISQKKEYVELAKSIKKIVCSISGNDYIDYEDNLLENGLDSLLLSQISGRIVSDIQEAQGMRFDEILRASLTMPTIMGIAQYISDCKNPSKNQMHSNAGNQTRNSYTVVYIFGDNENEIRDVLIEKLSASNISCKRVGGQEIIERCHEDINVKKKYIHVLYDGIDILGCALGGLSTWKLGNVAESYTTSMAGGGNRVISGIIGMVPVTFIVNTNVDRNDIDHPLHLYHRIELTFSTGRLCLVNTHGPVIWLPFLHMPRDEYGTLSINVEEEVNIPSGVTIGNVMLPSVKETFEQIWPDAVKKALEILFKQNRTEKMSMAQYQIYVSKLWSEICQKVGYMNIVDYDNFGDIKNIFYDLEKRHLIKKENDGIE